MLGCLIIDGRTEASLDTIVWGTGYGLQHPPATPRSFSWLYQPSTPASVAFFKQAAMKQLEAVVHPLVGQERKEWLEQVLSICTIRCMPMCLAVCTPDH